MVGRWRMPMVAMLTAGLVALPMVPLAAQSVPAPADAPAGLEGDEDAIFAAAVEATRQRDFAQAYDLFETLAEADVADAQFNLAVLVRQGRGRPQNYRTALFWAWLSHLGDEPRAQTLARELEQMLPPEVRAEVEDRVATRLQAQLARGDRSAILKYARLNGELKQEPDATTAYVWFSIATALGIPGGIDLLARHTREMELPAILEAQTQAEEVFARSAFAPGGGAAAP